MSLPTGSKFITNISTSSFNYLTDINTNSSWSSLNWSSKGKPLLNLTQETIDEHIFADITKALPERNTVNTTLFEDYPDLLISTTNTDLDIGSIDTDVDITFIDEGAGYQNSFGYYFYVVDNGVNKLLDNADNNSNNSLGYYKPTIVFPNASRKNGGPLRSNGGLVSGIKRRLKGNLANGKFKDVRVGFFVVPNGWLDSSNGVIYNNKNILHSTSELNPNYNTENAEDGIQTILFNTGSEYLLCFEDIQRPGGDSDFNDLIIKIETDVALNNINIISLPGTTIPSNMYHVDYSGSFIKISLNLFTDIDDNTFTYKFRRNLVFDNQSNRDQYIDSLSYLDYTLSYTTEILNANTLNIIFDLDQDDVKNNISGDETHIYNFLKSDNEDDEVIVDVTYNLTKYDKLIALQHLENTNVVNQDTYFAEFKSNVESILVIENDVLPYNSVNSLLVWGDPYVQTLNGKQIMLPHIDQNYKYLESGNIKILIRCENFTNHPIPEYRNTSFIRYVSFFYKETEVKVDMFEDLNIVKENKECADIKIVDDFRSNKFKSLQSIDPDIIVKQIYIKNISFLVALYPNYTEYYNEIYISKHTINMLSNIDGLITEGDYVKYIEGAF